MHRNAFVAISLALAAVIHADWHFARPTHHRLSLGWEEHWIFAAVAFAVAGCVVARIWGERSMPAALGILATAAFVAQGVEPVLEIAVYDHRLGYPDDPGRWRVFFVCMAVGAPVLLLTARLCRPGTPPLPAQPAA